MLRFAVRAGGASARQLLAVFRRAPLASHARRLRVRRVKAAIVVAVVALVATACGSARHVTFAASSQVCGLSVPIPRGFHRRFWNHGLLGGITISHGPLEPPATPGAAHGRRRQVSLTVSAHNGDAPELDPGGPLLKKLPSTVTLHDLEQSSPGSSLWGRAFEVGDHVCGVGVWLGRSASGADRAAVLGALQAIDPVDPKAPFPSTG